MRGTPVVQRGKVTPHWEVIDNREVQSVARKVAKSIADMNKGILEEGDLYQEALILVASSRPLAERAIVGEFGLLYSELRTVVMNRFVRPLMRTGEMEQRKYRTVSTEDADKEPQPYALFDDGTGDYTEDAVKLLLPAVWDESYAYGLPAREDAPDHDMPKSASNKARANNHWAYIADIKTGWEKTPLTLAERRAILLHYGMGWKQKDIAYNQAVSQKTISLRLDTAVKKITARLNGASVIESEEI